jgi:hypothetical protein
VAVRSSMEGRHVIYTEGQADSAARMADWSLSKSPGRTLPFRRSYGPPSTRMIVS